MKQQSALSRQNKSRRAAWSSRVPTRRAKRQRRGRAEKGGAVGGKSRRAEEKTEEEREGGRKGGREADERRWRGWRRVEWVGVGVGEVEEE